MANLLIPFITCFADVPFLHIPKKKHADRVHHMAMAAVNNPGAVMPHGVFVLADESEKLRIKGISQNCPQFFKKEAAALLGTSFFEVAHTRPCVYVCVRACV
jgi:hypothetical protein